MKARILFGLLGLAGALTLGGCGQSEPKSEGGPATVRRLTETQYRNTIADVFGSHIVVAGRFDPILRTNGLLAVGAGRAAITPSGFERYNTLARSIAGQVVSVQSRDLLIPCTPAAADKADDACAKTFLARVGRLLYRRPLIAEELDSQVAIAHEAAENRKDFYAGLAYGLQGLLEAPDFLFVAEGTDAGGRELDAFAKASRLSFLLWNTSPDDVLLTAAEKGDLKSNGGLTKQVDRMMASPRFKGGVRAFFTDMLSLDDFDNLAKDTLIYPAFTLTAASDAKEQTLRTLVDLLVTRDGDYRDLFTTRSTFMSSALGLVYRVPATLPGGWTKYEFPDGDARAGIQSQLSFVALHSHPGKSSPTLRGKAIRELLLCQKVPDPPGTVSFDQFNDPNSPNKTARDRLTVHATDPACAGCHKLMDPIGLALETFDGAGQIRATENGAIIDTSGEINGTPFADSVGLGKALRDDPAATSCVVNRAYSYGVGRAIAQNEKALLAYFEKSFADDGHRLPDLIRKIALSEAFYKVSAPAPAAPAAKSAATSGLESKS